MAKETNKLIRDSFFILIFFISVKIGLEWMARKLVFRVTYDFINTILAHGVWENSSCFVFLSDNKGLMEVIENKVQGTDDTKGDTKERQLDGEFFMFFTECLDESLFIKLSWYKRTAKRKQCYFHSIVVHIRVTCYSSSRPRIKASSSRENGEMNK